jgi:predicted glycogen debranching enzyme
MSMSMIPLSDRSEWLETDGLGGFASGTVAGLRTRRYHALLLVATTPPSGRVVLVNGFEAWVHTPAGRVALSSQRYGSDVTFPDGSSRLRQFTRDPWPQWTYLLDDGTTIVQEIVAVRDQPGVVVSWRLGTPASAVSSAPSVSKVQTAAVGP